MDENQTAANDTQDTFKATDLVTLERLIINYLHDTEREKEILKKHKEMLDNIFANNPEFQEANEKTKAANKEKAAVKADILHQTEAATLNDKVNDIRKRVREMQTTLSNHLQEYAKMSGTNQFEDDDGQVREIVYVAKVVKRSSKFRT